MNKNFNSFHCSQNVVNSIVTSSTPHESPEQRVSYNLLKKSDSGITNTESDSYDLCKKFSFFDSNSNIFIMSSEFGICT